MVLPGWWRVAGPASSAELKDLVKQGAIRPAMLIRRGDDGPWLPAERIPNALDPIAEAAPIPGPVAEPVEWYFSRQDRCKLGPVSWSTLLAMADQGKLEAVDLVWKPGMASWVAASELPDLRGERSAWAISITPGIDSSRRWYTFASRLLELCSCSA